MKDSTRKGLLIFPIMKDLNKSDGILVKNEGIKDGFVQNKVNVDVLEFTSSGIFNGNEQVYSFSKNRILRVYEYNTSIWNVMADYICQNHYSFVWFRIPTINIFVANFIKKVKACLPDCNIIIEYGAYPFLNELSGIRKQLYLLNKSFEKKAHKYADYVITYCGQDYVDNLRNIPINNGIDLSALPVNNIKTPKLDVINFICVSSLKKWHAYERFIEGLPKYLQSKDHTPIHFNIVGNGPEYDKLVTITNNLMLNDFVTFHNFKTGAELDLIYQKSHIAISTLGFHRIGITNSSSLKNREYFARGLPIVLSTPDLDMPADLPFVMYVPEGEEPVDIASVVEFSKACYQLPDLNLKVREYAENNISWKSKIKTVLEYID